MGIFTLLRNAFGRSRKPRATEPEGAPETPEQPPVPEPRQTPAEEHELVAAAFDKVTVPHQTPPAEATPKTTATTKPEPERKPEPEAEPEPEAAATPERTPEPEAATQTAAEPEPRPEPKPEAAATPEPTPEPEAATETAAESEPAPKREPETPAEPEPDPPTETDPQAADGEDAPQGPPAPDDETRTGGAGGNTTAEGEAEAPADTTPHADPPKPKPATPLTRVKSRTPTLTTAYKAATTTLRKKNLTGTRAKLYLVLDRSASMRPYYKDGSAQALADQILALAAHLDAAPSVHVVFFSTEVDGTTDLALAPGHDTRIDDVHAGLGRMGRTSYHAAVAAVLDHYDTHTKSDTAPAAPALVVFQTDGAPDAKTPATQALTEAAETHPGVFFSFVAFGDHDNKAFDYLRRLKTPNASFFHAGPTPRELTDTELYEGVLADWRP
ncbi:VWA domain-containing protein [Streptomyces nogalater]|uniref:VWA domain-containing protein n=1 Tax=Streptomyces nogalater TaxID=38314 RepID=A0ABW0WE75_STRNO